jgi:Rrf2 family protein
MADDIPSKHAVVTKPRNSGTQARARFYGASAEYALHCMTWLANQSLPRVSSRDLAEFQGMPAAMLAKILPKLERAKLVTSLLGIGGGYALAQPPEKISVMDIVDAVEGDRRIFESSEIRRRNILFAGDPPAWSTDGMCEIQAVMARAELHLRRQLSAISLRQLVDDLNRPSEFQEKASRWLRQRVASRQVAQKENASRNGNGEARKKPNIR